MSHGKWGSEGWAIYSPVCREIRYDTFRATRKEAIRATGIKDVKNDWAELYRSGYRAIKVVAEWSI